jgi:branched-chain amino acid transport system permease protein
MIGYAIFCLIITFQLGLLAQATDLLGGHAGRVGVASVLLAGTAGYAYAIFTVQAGWNPWWSVCLALGLTALISLALGWLLLHLRGNDFLLGTIAAQMGFSELANNLDAFGGALGVRNIPSLAGMSVSDAPVQGALWLLMPSSLIFGILLQRVLGERKYPTKILHWIRDDDISARTLGIAPERWRMAVFVLHAILAGLAGVSIVIAQGYVSSKSFDLSMSMTVLTVVYLSGTGGNPVLMYFGAAVLVAVGEFLRSFGGVPELVGPIQQITINAVLIAILTFMPRGLAGPIIEVGPSATRLE